MRIGVVSPSSLPKSERLFKGLSLLRDQESQLIIGKSCFHYLSPLERAEELEKMEDICDLLLCSRGGCGSFQLAPFLTRGFKIPICGYSDITFLLLWQYAHGERAFHGPMLCDFQRPTNIQPSFLLFLRNDITLPYRYPGMKRTWPLHPGQASGRLLAVNLSLLIACLPFFGDKLLEDSVLFLEDVSESVDSIERYLWALNHYPALAKVKGVVFSAFTETRRASNDYRLRDVLTRWAQEADIPCFIGFPAYHGKYIKHCLPIGGTVEIDSETGTVTLLSLGGAPWNS